MTSNTRQRPLGSTIIGEILVIVNPAAGGVNDDMVAEIIGGCAPVSPRVEWTAAAADAGRLSAEFAASASPGMIIVVGGDGTVAEVCSALAGRVDRVDDQPAILVIPAGSGNSTARNLWGDLDWRQVLDIATDHDRWCVKNLDLLRLEEPERSVLLGASTGFLAQVLIAARDIDPAVRGIDRYYAAAGSVIASMPRHPTRVIVDGETLWEGPTSSVTVGGGQFRARMFKFLPHSVDDDGLLDVCTIGALDADGVRELMPLLMTGQHVGCESVRYARGRRVVIESVRGDALVSEYDGDVWDAAGPRLTIDVLPQRIRMVCPKGK